jgi:hypothetical protein
MPGTLFLGALNLIFGFIAVAISLVPEKLNQGVE